MPGRPAVVVRIVANLLTYARKQARSLRKPVAELRSEIQGEKVWLSIDDNSAGMTSSFRPGSPEGAARSAADAQGLGWLSGERAVNRLGSRWVWHRPRDGDRTLPRA